jgi:hypothetical protein
VIVKCLGASNGPGGANFGPLDESKVSKREQQAVWHDERKARAARIYVEVTDPTIVAALIGAVVVIGIRCLT